MHLQILSDKQVELIKYLALFKRTFYLVGGTAIAFHLGHRRSIDFDLFNFKKLNKLSIKKKLLEIPYQQTLLFEDHDQMHWIINDIKVTFFNYPYAIEHQTEVGTYLKMPDLLILAAMKAFALGRRAKWKDYIDLYFIIKDHFSILQICDKANEIYKEHFSDKLFRGQLAYHKDIDYSEQVEYLIPAPNDKEVKEFLINKATEVL